MSFPCQESNLFQRIKSSHCICDHQNLPWHPGDLNPTILVKSSLHVLQSRRFPTTFWYKSLLFKAYCDQLLLLQGIWPLGDLDKRHGDHVSPPQGTLYTWCPVHHSNSHQIRNINCQCLVWKMLKDHLFFLNLDKACLSFDHFPSFGCSLYFISFYHYMKKMFEHAKIFHKQSLIYFTLTRWQG